MHLLHCEVANHGWWLDYFVACKNIFITNLKPVSSRMWREPEQTNTYEVAWTVVYVPINVLQEGQKSFNLHLSLVSAWHSKSYRQLHIYFPNICLSNALFSWHYFPRSPWNIFLICQNIEIFNSYSGTNTSTRWQLKYAKCLQRPLPDK